MFEKGVSGNPGGRPKDTAMVRDLIAKEHGVRLVGALAEIAYDTKQRGSVRVAALTALLDRWIGKPVQAVANEDGTPLLAGSEAILSALQRLAEK